jgi:hypothetical protein
MLYRGVSPNKASSSQIFETMIKPNIYNGTIPARSPNKERTIRETAASGTSYSYSLKSPKKLDQSQLVQDIQWVSTAAPYMAPSQSSPNGYSSPYRQSPSRRSPRKAAMASPGRVGSPTRYHKKELAYDAEVNRAFAREMYVNSTVNVVNPSSKRSPGKVKPG